MFTATKYAFLEEYLCWQQVFYILYTDPCRGNICPIS